MTGAEHYAMAERLIQDMPDRQGLLPNRIALAQVHATLAAAHTSLTLVADALPASSEEEDQAITDAVAALDALPVDDPERAHGNADRILLAVTPAAVRDAYNRAADRSAWW